MQGSHLAAPSQLHRHRDPPRVAWPGLCPGDEGYYDAFSPGSRRTKEEAHRPRHSHSHLPRDSWWRRLYELFYDPAEAGVQAWLMTCVGPRVYRGLQREPHCPCAASCGAEENLAPCSRPRPTQPGLLLELLEGKRVPAELCEHPTCHGHYQLPEMRRGRLRALPPAASTLREPAAPSGRLVEKPGAGSEKMGLGPVKLDGRGTQALDAGRISMSSVPSRKELWACSGPKGLLAGVSKGLAGAKQETKSSSCDPCLGGVPVWERGLEATLKARSPCRVCSRHDNQHIQEEQGPTPICLAWLPGARLPRNLRCFQGPWRPGPGEAPWIQNSP